jgi:RNA polymerase sigma factor (sigma-70 family)
MSVTRHSGQPRRGNHAEDDHVAALIARAREGDQAAWNDLVNQYTALLWRVARSHRLNSADAADAVQITWLRCVENLHRIREPHRLGGWLITTCARECLHALRRNARSQATDPHDPLGPLAQLPDEHPLGDPVAVLLARERQSILRQAVARLPDTQRQVLSLTLNRENEVRSAYANAAEVLRKPIGSLGPTRHRALRRLRHDPKSRNFTATVPSRAGRAEGLYFALQRRLPHRQPRNQPQRRDPLGADGELDALEVGGPGQRPSEVAGIGAHPHPPGPHLRRQGGQRPDAAAAARPAAGRRHRRADPRPGSSRSPPSSPRAAACSARPETARVLLDGAPATRRNGCSSTASNGTPSPGHAAVTTRCPDPVPQLPRRVGTRGWRIHLPGRAGRSSSAAPCGPGTPTTTQPPTWSPTAPANWSLTATTPRS